MYEISVDETFSAGHYLRGYHGKCEAQHGHNYRVRVAMEGPKLDAAGLLYDFVHLKQVIQRVIHSLDHRNLNDFPPFDKVNPSAENIAKHIHDEIAKQMNESENDAKISGVTVWETETSAATFRPRSAK